MSKQQCLSWLFNDEDSMGHQDGYAKQNQPKLMGMKEKQLGSCMEKQSANMSSLPILFFLAKKPADSQIAIPHILPALKPKRIVEQ